jgi:hypothetical protein
LRELLGSNSYDLVVGNRIIGAIPVRKKNQYRIYLSSGDIIVATYPDNEGEALKFTRQHYTAYHQDDSKGYEAVFAPTALSSAVVSNGEESVLMGTRLGHVMRVDPKYMDILSYASKSTGEAERGTALSSWKFFKFLDFNPLHAPDPSAAMKFSSAEVYLEHGGWTNLNHLAGTDYNKFSEIPALGSESVTVGNSTSNGNYGEFPGQLVDDYFTWYIDITTDGLSMRYSKFGGVGSVPTRLNSIYMHAEIKGDRHGGIREARDYSTVVASIPEDILITGITGDAVFAGGLGNPQLNVGITGITGDAAFDGTLGSITYGPDVWTMDETFTLDSGTHKWDGTKP